MVQLRKVLQGSASNVIRLLLSGLVGFVLPPFLVRHMPPAEYSAWVLVLQLSAYVSLLDLGLQTAIGKFVAEYDSAGDRLAGGRVLSSSFAILLLAAVVGVGLIGVLTWQVPCIFHQMPANLIYEVRASLLLVGTSVSVGLPFNAFLASFTGLQKYGFPTIVLTISKILSSAALVGVLLTGASLVQLALVMAAFNVATSIAQYFGWKTYIKEKINFSLKLYDRQSAWQLSKYCSALSVWTVAGLLISGLDTVIIGHYDYRNTGYYAVAGSVTNFMLLGVGSLFGPLIPAVSSLQAVGSSRQIGDITVNTTRYCVLVLCLLGLPLFFGAYPLLSLWIGKDYARSSAPFLQLLILGNVVRQVGYPYALVVVATGRQHLATLSGIVEALVNLSMSIWLVHTVGAIGVAIGTLAGAFISIALHILVSMHYTRPMILIHRSRFVLQGLLRPLLCLAPSLLMFPFWKQSAMLPATPVTALLWAVTTLSIAWSTGLTSAERVKVRTAFNRLVYWSDARA